MADPVGPEVGRVSVRVLPNTAHFKLALRKFLERAERSYEVRLPTALNTKGAERDLRRLRSQAERSQVEINTGLDTKAAKAELQALKRGRHKIKVGIDLDMRSLASALAKVSAAQVAIAGGAGLAASLASSLVTATQTVGTLVVGLAEAATGLAALGPAALGAAGAIGGTLALALIGVGESTAKSVKQIRSAIRDLMPAFNDLRRTLRERLLEGFGKELRELGKIYLPVLRRGLGGIASDINGIVLEMSKFMRQSYVVRDFEQVIGRTRSLLAGFKGAVAPVLQIFNDLAVVGSEFFGPFGLRVAAATQRWAEFIRQARMTGELSKFIRDALISGGVLVRMFQDLGGVVAGVFRAMQDGGQATLGTLGRIVGNLHQFVDSVEGQTALKAFFAGIRDIADAINPALREVIISLGRVAPIVGKLAQALGPSLQAVIRSLADALEEMAPGFLAFGEALAEGLMQIAPGLRPVGRAIGELLGALSPLLPMLGSVGAAFGQIVGVVGRALAPVIYTIASALADTLAPILPVIVENFRRFGAAIAPVLDELGVGLVNALDALAPHLPQLATSFGNLALAFADLLVALSPVLPAVGTLAGILAGTFAQAVSYAVDALTWLVAGLAKISRATEPFRAAMATIVNAIRSPANIVPSVVAAVAAAFQTMNRTVIKVGTSIANGIRGAWNAVRSVTLSAWNAIKSATSAAWNAVRSTVRSAWDSVRTTVSSAIRNVVSLVRSLPQRAASALAGIGSRLVGSGRALIQGFINGIRQKIGDLRRAVQEAVSVARNFFPFSPAKEGPFSGRGWVIYSGRAVSTDFAKGIKQRQDHVVRAVKSMTQAARDAGEDLGPSLKDDLLGTARGRLSSLTASGPRLPGLGAAHPPTPTPATNVFQFNARTVDVEEHHIVPLVNTALLRSRVGSVI